MRHTALLRGWLLVGIPLASLLLVVGGAPRAFGDDPMPPAGMDGDPEPGMAEGAKEGDDSKLDPDAEDDVPASLKDRVDAAVAKGVAWLQKKQANGSWGPMDVSKGGVYGGGKGKPYDHPAGPTALALYTLLKCRMPKENNVIQSGFSYLDKKFRRPEGTYETAMVLLAICATADASKKTVVSEANRNSIREKLTGPMRKWAQEMVESLLRKHESKDGRKGWRYQLSQGTAKPTQAENNSNEDMSSTQLVALSLFAADRCGVRTPTPIWRDILAFSRAQQAEDGPEVQRTAHLQASKAGKRDPKAPPPPAAPAGTLMDHARGFSYIKSSPDPGENQPYNSMTACGLAGLMLPRFVLDTILKDKNWAKGGLDAKVQQDVYDALAWLELNWSPFENTKHQGWHSTYYLYCVERAMDLVGNKLIGKHMWYLEGAEQLVNRQSEQGFWDSKKTYDPSDIIDTCFALLFLRRSTKGTIPFPDVTGGSDEPPVDRRGKTDDEPDGN